MYSIKIVLKALYIEYIVVMTGFKCKFPRMAQKLRAVKSVKGGGDLVWKVGLTM